MSNETQIAAAEHASGRCSQASSKPHPRGASPSAARMPQDLLFSARARGLKGAPAAGRVGLGGPLLMAIGRCDTDAKHFFWPPPRRPEKQAPRAPVLSGEASSGPPDLASAGGKGEIEVRSDSHALANDERDQDLPHSIFRHQRRAKEFR